MSTSSSSHDTNNYHVCRICSDRAIGYNFSVLTCEPCKAFFRRTADKLEELQCPFNNDCDIDRVTRKICRRCRLVKCLKVGMRKDWAQSDDEKKPRYASSLVSRSNKISTSSDSTESFKGGLFSLMSNGCNSRRGGGDDNDDFGLLRHSNKCKELTSRSFNQDTEFISPTSSDIANDKNWSTSSLPSPSSSSSPSSFVSLVSMSPTKTRASFNQLPVTPQSSKSSSLSSSLSSSTSSSPSTLASSSSCMSSKLLHHCRQYPQSYTCSSSSSSSSSSSLSSSSSSYLNHFGQNKHNSGIMSNLCSSSSSPLSTSLTSSSPIIPNIDLMNSLQQSCVPQANYKQQTREEIQSILRSAGNSDWLIRFLVESHALNLPTSKQIVTPTIFESNFKTNQQQPTTDTVTNDLKSATLPCTRVGVIVDGRKLAPSISQSPPSTINANNESSCYYPSTSSSKHQQPLPPPPLLTSINNQIDHNLKTRVIRKILDANFAPSHLKQGYRKGVALDDKESGTIDTLLNAFDFFNQPLTVNNCELTSIEGVTRFTDLYLEKLISGCQCLSSYAQLCLEDQISLVKGGFPFILAVRSYLFGSMSTTNPTTPPTSSSNTPSSSLRASDNCWQSTTNQHNQQPDHPLRQIQTDSLKNTSVYGNLVNAHWINDPKVACILIAIVLFNPDLSNLQAIDAIKLEQYTYIYLLKRYLESQCGSSCRAQTEHFNLIHSIEKIMSTRSERTFYPSRMTFNH